MTTIATDGKVMAGDSLVCAGGQFVGLANKVQRTPDGRLFGASGLSADCAMFAKWMRGDIDRPDLSDEFSALVLMPDGKLFYLCSKLEPVEFLTPNAIGSGGDIALGAMLAGRSPGEAVVIASTRDTGTGGEVTELELGIVE